MQWFAAGSLAWLSIETYRCRESFYLRPNLNKYFYPNIQLEQQFIDINSSVR